MAAASIKPLNRLGIAQLVMSYLPEDDPLKKQQEKTRNIASARIQECFLQMPDSQHPFWGLGKQWWMQIIDGRFHHHGPLVFDEGLHGKEREPGFYDSIQLASEYAVKNQASLTIPFYLQLHRLACSHFAGKASRTLITAQETGKFGTESVDHVVQSQRFPFLFDVTAVQRIRHQYEADIELCKKRDSILTIRQRYRCTQHRLKERDFFAESMRASKRLESLERDVLGKIDQINAYIVRRSLALGFAEPIVKIHRLKNSIGLLVEHRLRSAKQIEAVVRRLFIEFNTKMTCAQSDDEKIVAIADLFQVLEWVHPFRDGNSRTNLTLLSKLLADYGLNPPILEHPYVSLCWTLDAWVRYLKEGMTLWRQQAGKQ